MRYVTSAPGPPGGGSSLLDDAVAELYAADPDEFVGRRKELAARARAAGDRAAAKEIAALGKPTRSAWLINRLVRADPSVPARLTELGDQLRAGEAALDGASIRRLSAARRELIDALVRQATGAAATSAALREEVTDTFNAALADPEVAALVASGTLLRAARWAGFAPGIGTAAGAGGSGGSPPDRYSGGSPPRASTAADPMAAWSASLPVAAPATPSRSTAGPAKRAPDDRADRRRQAEEAAADAALALQAAAAAERDKQEAVRRIETQLAEHRQQIAQRERGVAVARQQLEQAQRDLAGTQHQLADAEQNLAAARQDLKAAGILARQAVDAQRKAQQAVDRLSR